MKNIYKKWALAALFAPFACGAFAADGADKLVVTTTGGSTVTLEVADVGHLSFGNEVINLHMADGTVKTLHLTTVQHLAFDLESSSTEELVAAAVGDDITVSISSGIVTLASKSGAPVEAMVYTLNGTLVYAASSHAAVEIDFNTFARGAYIICANGKAIKLAH